MLAAAEELRFEYAARLRDEIKELRRELLQIESAGLRCRPAVRLPRVFRAPSMRGV